MKSLFKNTFQKGNIVLIILLWAISACVSPVDIQPSDFESSLVVEGFITNDFGPHNIEITRLARFASVLEGGSIERVNAIVNIIDDLGNRTPLFRESVIRKELFNEPPGCNPNLAFPTVTTRFRTPADFRGEVGRTYILEILVDDNTYQSTPQEMLSTPPIEELELTFRETPTLNSSISESGFDVISTWNDPEGDDFYSWRVNGIYRISTPPLGGTSCCLYDPSDGGEINCWIRERDIEGNVRALSDRLFDGATVSEKIGFIKDDGLRFVSLDVPPQKQYYVEVEQSRISKDAFEFIDKIDIISSIDGEIFDPPPLGIRGNIFNINDENEQVIGFFGAYSIQKKDIFVQRDDLPFLQRALRPCGDCRVRVGAQTEVPDPYK